jgi:GT2 family glycosyltransferase
MMDVVIVNWNAGPFLRPCLASLDKNHAGLVNKVLVVDNASHDRSGLDALEFKSHSFESHVIRNVTNEGFAAACNKGAKACHSEFILFLNPDCEIYPSTLQDMLAEMRALPLAEYAVAGIRLVGTDGSIARGCARQPSAVHYWVKLLGMDRLSAGRIRSHVMTEWPHTESRDVEHVIGAFYLVRRNVFEALGGFDERFFVYLEDLDLSRRILRAGYRIRYLSSACALHVGGGSSSQIKARRLYYSLRSRILFAFKHFSAPGAWALAAGTVLLEPLIRLVYSLARLDFREARETAGAYAMLWTELPRLPASRRLA